MKTCKGCKYAEWRVDENGNLHPNGEGYCNYNYKFPPLPGGLNYLSLPVIMRGSAISRYEKFTRDCVYYESGTL